MALLGLHDISFSISGKKLFENVNLQLEPGEKVALIGRNGCGKTTLMKMICGEVELEGGKIDFARGVQRAYLSQEIPPNLSGSVFDVVLGGLTEHLQLIQEYNEVNRKLETQQNPQLLTRLAQLQQEMETRNAWQVSLQIETQIEQLGLSRDAEFNSLSGGQKKRAMLARALVRKPEILLLDEPTNHLDIESIEWLEKFLKSYSGTLFFVTHDRAFMQSLATRIVEIDRGKFYNWTCNYKTYLERKQNQLEIEAVEQALFDKKLAQEESWVRQGVKARRTRNEGRVRALQELRAQKKQQRRAPDLVSAQLQEAARSGQVVIKTKNLSFAYGNKKIVENFSGRVLQGDKVGLIGSNGSGKTTLIRLLLAQIKPQSGHVELGSNLELAYFDQHRAELDETKSVKDNVCPHGETVEINGQSRHVMGYLQDFLFTPDRARTMVKYLSGGERNRLLLARLLTKSCNLLVLDEPTNDLDIETLELLESLLVNFSGTILLVSHDRQFLNNVVTSTFAISENGEIKEYAGGYDDYLLQRGEIVKKIEKPTEKKPIVEKVNTTKKLSFKQLRELEILPTQIEELDAQKQIIINSMQQEDFYKKPPEEIVKIKNQLEQIEQANLQAFNRWQELEDLKQQIKNQ